MTTCPNCDTKSYAANTFCRACGYKPVDARDLGPLDLVYCEACGCHYGDRTDAATRFGGLDRTLKCPAGHDVTPVKREPGRSP